MDRGDELLAAIAEAEAALNFNMVFRQETGEEAVHFMKHGDTVQSVLERYPEWTFVCYEVVRDANWYECEAARNEYRFWLDTKDMTDEEYEGYVDACMDEYDNEYDY